MVNETMQNLKEHATMGKKRNKKIKESKIKWLAIKKPNLCCDEKNTSLPKNENATSVAKMTNLSFLKGNIKKY